MYFFNIPKICRRHHFLSITRASIISCLYYNLFIRNLYTHSLSNLKYCKIISLFDSNTKSISSSGSLLTSKYFFYITKLYSGTSRDSFRTYSKLSILSDSKDSGFKHSITSMPLTTTSEEPEWVKESKDVSHPEFENQGNVYLSELGVLATTYKHKKSGLSVISMKTDLNSGKEMCFNMFVPTPPFNSRGSPHVLEHCVLAGTPKYPSKDGFFAFVQGSFTSFLNATTYKDRTNYIFASINEKSFYQVADYYMDSFFRPNITHDKSIFEQECWHYKVTKGDSVKSDSEISLHGRNIGFSGIVYSEMKLRFSDSSDLLYYLSYESLFSNSYKYVSGGDPKDIVDLTHQELLNFYKMYYGPKTSTLYLYGPYDVKNRLNFVDEYLTKYKIGMDQPTDSFNFTHKSTLASSDSNLKLEEYKKTPLYATSQFNSSNPTEDEFMVSWIVDPAVNGSIENYNLDLVDNVGFQILEYLLIGTPESVLYKALIDSGFGKKVIGYGFSNSYRQSLFSVGIKGVDNQKNGTKEEMVKKFEKIVFDTLNKVKQEGFKRDAIDSGVNLIEFDMRELNTGSYPKGLMLINLIQQQLQYGKDPYGFLRFDSLMSELRSRVFKDNPSIYFVNLLVKHLLNNTTRVVIHLEAVESTKFEKEFNNKIKKQLENRLSHLSKEDVDKMEEYYKTFKEQREKQDDSKNMSAFQTLELKDISRDQEKIPSKFYKLSQNGLSESESLYNDTQTLTVLTHPLDSQGILYMDYGLSLDLFSVDDVRYLGLFLSMLKESGTYTLSSEEMVYRVGKNLGGLSFSSFFSTECNNRTYDDVEKGLGYVFVRSKCLKHKVDDMVDIVNDVLKNANFSNSKKGLELINRMVSLFQTNIVSYGHQFASRRMSRKFSVSHFADELVNGYSQFIFLKDKLLPLAESNWSEVERRLNGMREKLLLMSGLTVNLTGDSELVNGFLNKHESFYEKLSNTFNKESKGETKVWVQEILQNKLMESNDKNELIVTPTKVNYVALGGKLFDKNDKALGSNSLSMHYVGESHLIKCVRMSLGAYGVQADLYNTGHVVFVSYADPNFEKTLEVYKKVPQALKEAYESFTENDLLRQKMGKLSGLDKPLHVESKSLLSLKRVLRNESDEFRQFFREDILDTSKQCLDRLRKQFESHEGWKNVCAVVDNSTSNEASNEFKRLYIS